MIRMQLLAQFPVDHVSYSIIPIFFTNLLYRYLWGYCLVLFPQFKFTIFPWLVLMLLFWYTIKNDLVSLFRFPLRRHIRVNLSVIHSNYLLTIEMPRELVGTIFEISLLRILDLC